MATYSVYNNILVKLEDVFLRVEMEVDREITSLLTEHTNIKQQLVDLKGKLEILNSLKRSFELYNETPSELEGLNRSLFKVVCDKQISLRFLQEKEILMNGYLVPAPDMQVPTVIQVNREYKLRKHLQEIQLLASFLADEKQFAKFAGELERANEILDLAVESGASDKLESALALFDNFFEKILNLYDLPADLIENFKVFRTQIVLQANNIPLFAPQDVETLKSLHHAYKQIHDERVQLEQEVQKLLYQFSMFQNGRAITLAEIKNASGELESILFKEYAIKQKLQELRQYKVELNSQKDNFMKDPTIDGYTEAVQHLEGVEKRFRRLMMHKSHEQQRFASHFFHHSKGTAAPVKVARKDETPYNKILFQVLHNNHVSSQDKMVIFRLSKPSRMINTNSGKFFFQRTGKTRTLENLERSLRKLQAHELH